VLELCAVEAVAPMDHQIDGALSALAESSE
jgi:hypothetical protein